MNSYGLVFGGEDTSHESGNDILYNVKSDNGYTNVLIEGDEYILPKEAMLSEKYYHFKDKLAIEILDAIKSSVKVYVSFPNLREGDMVICKSSVRNDELHTVQGTAKEIANYLQGISECRMYAVGGVIEIADEPTKDTGNQRLITPMPPALLKGKGEDSLYEIVGKDDMRPMMSGIYYDKDGVIVATDATILVVLKNQSFPTSKIGKAFSYSKSKKPENQLEGIYPKYKMVFPSNDLIATKSNKMPIDLLLDIAYGGVIEGKRILKEKELSKYEKNNFKFLLPFRIGLFQAFIDSFHLYRLLRALKANGCDKIALNYYMSDSSKKEMKNRVISYPILVETDQKHVGLVMPFNYTNDSTDDHIYKSQNFYLEQTKKYRDEAVLTCQNYLDELTRQAVVEYCYIARVRPITEAYPKENIIRIENDEKFGRAVYSAPLTLEQIEHYSFFPIQEIKQIGDKVKWYEDNVADVRTDMDAIFLTKYLAGEIVETETMSVYHFLDRIKKGVYVSV